MTVSNYSDTIWMLGLDEASRDLIEKTTGNLYRYLVLDTLNPIELSTILDTADDQDPLLLWLGGATWLKLRAEYPDLMEKMLFLPIVLVLEAQPDRQLMEQALTAPMQQVFLEPISASQVHDAVSRALETRNIYCEMARMSREVSMERELLDRKTDVCAFLFNFFAQAGESDNACNLAAACSKIMRDFCGLSALHIAWWGNQQTISYVIGTAGDNPNCLKWRDFLREQAKRLLPEAEDGVCINWEGQVQGPEKAKVLLLPMTIRNRSCGLMALYLEQPMLQSRDIAQALDVVRRHLTLALWEGSADKDFFRNAARADLSAPRASMLQAASM